MNPASAAARECYVVAIALIVIAGCASDPTHPTAELASVRVALAALDDRGYEGGLNPSDVALAEQIAALGLDVSGPYQECPEPDPRAGQLLATADRADAPLEPIEPGPYRLIDRFILEGNRRQRDVAALALSRIGSVALIEHERLRSYDIEAPWVRYAMSEVSCVEWTPGDVFAMWSPERAASLSEATSGAVFEAMIEQMLDPSLRYPPEIFAYAIGNRGLSASDPAEAAGRLLPVIATRAYDRDTRMQALRFVRLVGTQVEGLREAVLLARETPDEELRLEAEQTLIDIGAPEGADLLSDRIEQGWNHWSWDESWNCKLPPPNARLVHALIRALETSYPSARAAAASMLGCVQDADAVIALGKSLDSPFWSVQHDTLEALRRYDELPTPIRERVASIASEHWSSRVRAAAANVEIPLSFEEPDEELSGRIEIFCFHRCVRDHGLPVCHGEQPGDGLYALPWLEPFIVTWIDAVRGEVPAAFNIELHELRDREGYGTNTFYRVDDGWLFGTDLWHYDGEVGFVSDAGEVQRFAPEIDAALIIDTQFGITLLGQDVFNGGEGGVLAVLERGTDGAWTYEHILELPSEAFGYAIAPDGTLLVKDPYGAYAVTTDKRIWPLRCAE